MLKRIKITDNQKTSLNYLSEVFQNGTEFNFKPGINILIGGNGCGKSTLLKLIYNLTLCTRTHSSRVPSDILVLSDLFEDNNLLDGAIVEHDYRSVVFRLLPSIEVEGNNVMSSIETFSAKYYQYSNSVGESMLDAVSLLFKVMFEDTTDYVFPIKKLKELSENSTSTWRTRIESLLSYYEKNACKVTPEDFEYTVLMDEPDRNLDIDNITSLYNILSKRKELTQMIAVVHNPILIYKLSKLDYINFIEVEPNYLYKVKNLIKAIK